MKKEKGMYNAVKRPGEEDRPGNVEEKRWPRKKMRARMKAKHWREVRRRLVKKDTEEIMMQDNTE